MHNGRLGIFHHPRSRWLYAAAWLPYALSYFLLFRPQYPQPALAAARALCNVLPAALLGILVIRLARRLPWATHTRRIFLFTHLAAAMLYSLTWWAAIRLADFLLDSLANHRWLLADWGAYAGQWQFFAGLMIYGNIIGFCYVIDAQRRFAEAETSRTQAELHALRAQLNPHFLFNALHSVTTLVALDPPKAEQALLRLSEMLRYTLPSAQPRAALVTLREELAFTDSYLALESLRLGDRLRIERFINPSALSWELPALTLQPLVENAIRHGIAPLPQGGVIRLAARIHQDSLFVEIADNGCGADALTTRAGTGLGLRTVRQRLAHCAATLDVQTAPGQGCTVSLTFAAA